MILIIPKIGYCKKCQKVFKYFLTEEPKFCGVCDKKPKKELAK